MKENWRYSATSITKYNPEYRDENGHYTKDEWVGFFQIGKIFDGRLLTFESYLTVEEKYLQAAILFFEFHDCDKVILRSVEKNDFSAYNYEDREDLMVLYDNITDGYSLSIKNLGKVVKLILRELLWAESFCIYSEDVALRFSHDFYMYFNSNKEMTELFTKIESFGLYAY